MNKSDFVDEVSEKCGSTKMDAARAIDAFFDVIADALQSGDEVRIAGFGTFSVSHRAARMGKNPRTGEKIKIAASRQPKFRPG